MSFREFVPDCPACGVWTCSDCFWKRRYAPLSYPQSCGRCGKSDGTISPTRHTSLAKREDHIKQARGNDA